MNIIIDGKRAVVEKDISIEYTCENPLFTDAEGYTLTISFPLVSCPDNIAIFGHINRKDIDTEKSVFPCQISCPGFEKSGALAITEISESEVKGQFLEGQSVANYTAAFSPLDTIYVDELNIGEISLIERGTPDFLDYYTYKRDYVIMPWKDVESGTVYNDLSSGTMAWKNQDEEVTVFPFLLPLIKSIYNNIGYQVDLSEWEKEENLANIIVCNTFVGQLYYTQSLPHWTAQELLDKLALFLLGRFEINDVSKSISFKRYIDDMAQVLAIENVINDFSAESTDDCRYIGSSRVKYADRDDEQWSFDCCNDLFANYPKVDRDFFSDPIKKESYEELVAYAAQWHRIGVYEEPSRYIGAIYYANDVDTYFCMKCTYYRADRPTDGSGAYLYKSYSAFPINRFSPYNSGKDSANEIEIEIVPAHISPFYLYEYYINVSKRTNNGSCIKDTLSFVGSLPQPTFAANILNGYTDIETWSFAQLPVAVVNTSFSAKYKTAAIDYFVASNYGVSGRAIFDSNVNFRLSRLSNIFPDIDETQKYTFEFIASDFPDVKSIFYIKGKKYLCEKITANITYRGISELKKGSFYRIVD